MVRVVPGLRKIRICYENYLGDFAYRWVEVLQTREDTDQTLMTKARGVYRARWGERSRVVAIDLQARPTRKGKE